MEWARIDGKQHHTIIKYIRTITQNRKEWFQKNGELKAAAATEEFCEIIEEVAKGDHECMHLLELDENLNFSFDVFKKVPTAQRLGLYYKSAKDLCVVGIKMEDELIQKIHLGILEYLERFQVQGYPEEPELCSKTFELHHVCTTLQDEVKDRSVLNSFYSLWKRRKDNEECRSVKKHVLIWRTSSRTPTMSLAHPQHQRMKKRKWRGHP